MLSTSQMVDKYFLRSKLPHIWCSGCGIGTINAAFLRALDEVGLDRDRVTLVNGIGCSGRTGAYLDFDLIKGTHGRALSFATGIKLFRPELTVVVMFGDGDAAAIGGNHLIHAARRNLDVTAIVINNQIYGMTGGQVSPTTPFGDRASTAPLGSHERPFDICQLAIGAGATYVARITTYHVRQAIRILRRAIEHKGFSLVEAVCQCPMYYGRYNKAGTPAQMMRWQRDHAVSAERAAIMSAEGLQGKFVIGELANVEAPEYVEEYLKLCGRARGGTK